MKKWYGQLHDINRDLVSGYKIRYMDSFMISIGILYQDTNQVNGQLHDINRDLVSGYKIR